MEWQKLFFCDEWTDGTGHLIGDLPMAKDLAVKYWFKRHIPLTIAATAVVTALRLLGVI